MLRNAIHHACFHITLKMSGSRTKTLQRVGKALVKSLSEGNLSAVKSVPEIKNTLLKTEYKINTMHYNSSKALNAFLYGQPKVTGQIPFMVTSAMKQRLFDLGYSKPEVSSMTPKVAWAVLEGRVIPADFRLQQQREKTGALLEADTSCKHTPQSASAAPSSLAAAAAHNNASTGLADATPPTDDSATTDVSEALDSAFPDDLSVSVPSSSPPAPQLACSDDHPNSDSNDSNAVSLLSSPK